MAIYFPSLVEARTTRDMTSVFRGYNHNVRIRDDEFYEMENMSADFSPVLSPRRRRGMVRAFSNPNGLYAHNKLCWVDGTEFWYDGAHIEGLVLEDGKKTIVGMGAYVLIWPDKVFYNSSDGTFGALGNEVVTTTTVTATLCKRDGSDYSGHTVSDTAPANPANGALWIDTSDVPHVLRQFSESSGMWSSVPTTYVKIAATGIGAGFAELDGVSISGMTDDALNGEFILYGAGADYIIVTAIIDATVTQPDAVTVVRKVPDMDFVTENENRIWGCSSANHEIYACKLGDPKNWNVFMGIASDSYAMTVGSAGDFTGACTHMGYVLFFKEDMIHKVYGNKPANYQLTNIPARGVERGSERSAAIVNEVLIYKARRDVCAFHAALPESISDALGAVVYKNAVAGAHGAKYYVSMADAAGAYSLFVFDTERGLWHREDNTQALFFAAYGPDMYYVDGATNALYSVAGLPGEYEDEGAELEPPVRWHVETGDLGLDSPDMKYISKLQIRLEAESGTRVRVAVQYDASGVWEEVYKINADRKRSFTAPIVPRRCDTMRVRISGVGACAVYSLTKTVEQGSEL